MTTMSRIAVAGLGLGLPACAGAPSDASTATTSGTVSGIIDYGRDTLGVLRVGAFATFPPFGPPVAEVAIDEPSFPQPYQIVGLPPGRYFVLAMVDTSPDDGDRYRPVVDPGGAFGRYDSPRSVTLDVGRPTTGVDLVLVAPTPSSPWGR